MSNKKLPIDIIIYEDAKFKRFLSCLCCEMNPEAEAEEIERAIMKACDREEILVLTLPSIDCLGLKK